MMLFKNGKTEIYKTVVLYRCETQYLKLREQHRFKSV